MRYSARRTRLVIRDVTWVTGDVRIVSRLSG
jgi:hypothetical protein